MKKINEYLLLFLSLWFISCSEELVNQPIEFSSAVPPALDINQLNIKPIGGGAIIYYTLPKVKDLLGVEVRYELSTGEKYKMRSSALVDSIVVEGYMDTIPHTIELYTVTKSEIFSEATLATIKPDKSPLMKIIDHLTCIPNFGGMQIKWENEDEVPIALFVSRIIENDTVDVSSFYSKLEKGLFTIRGLKSEESTFLIRFRDKFQNYTDYQQVVLTPLYEVELDYSQFKIMPASYHKNVPSWWYMQSLWDHGDPGAYWPWDSTTPWYSSVDMGKPVKVSRFVIYQYHWGPPYHVLYSYSQCRTWNFYGSNDPSPEMDNWNLIVTYEVSKPSGGPLNSGSQYLTQEDIDLAANIGFEVIVPIETPKYRYLRVECTRTCSGTTIFGACSEIHFFGNDR